MAGRTAVRLLLLAALLQPGCCWFRHHRLCRKPSGPEAPPPVVRPTGPAGR